MCPWAKASIAFGVAALPVQAYCLLDEMTKASDFGFIAFWFTLALQAIGTLLAVVSLRKWHVARMIVPEGASRRPAIAGLLLNDIPCCGVGAFIAFVVWAISSIQM